MGFSYRHSRFKGRAGRFTIAEARYMQDGRLCDMQAEKPGNASDRQTR